MRHVAPVAAVDAPRSGRRRDASRDAAILAAAIAILAETGYERMTMDMVADRARAGKGTVYRRWPSKQAMALEAIAQMKRDQVDLGNLPDTGTLRGDMLSLSHPSSVEETGMKLRVMAGLATMLSQEPSMADAAVDAIVEPWVAANRALLRRAIGRGEIAATVPVETLAAIIPSLGLYRSSIERKPFDRAFLIEMLDCVLLPALGICEARDFDSAKS